MTMRFAALLTASSVLSFAAIAQAECSWRLGWPNDDRMWSVPWGGAPRDRFPTRMECERAIDTMLGEAVRGQALLIQLPACVCAPSYDDFAQGESGRTHPHVDRAQRSCMSRG
jgi:hypothetical protein